MRVVLEVIRRLELTRGEHAEEGSIGWNDWNEFEDIQGLTNHRLYKDSIPVLVE